MMMGERTIANQKSSSLFELFSFFFSYLIHVERWKTVGGSNPIAIRVNRCVKMGVHFAFLIF
jgi:hypothetical protein